MIVSKFSSLTSHTRTQKDSGGVTPQDSRATLKNSWPRPTNYFELHEQDKRRGHSATIRAGAEDYSDDALDTPFGYEHKSPDVEKGIPVIPESGIQKIVRMETFRH